MDRGDLRLFEGPDDLRRLRNGAHLERFVLPAPGPVLVEGLAVHHLEFVLPDELLAPAATSGHHSLLG